MQQQVSCNNNNLLVIGAGNCIEASGYCNRIEIVGADSSVSADGVSDIKITGASFSVLYKSSNHKSAKARVSITGVGCCAKKQR